MNSPIAEVFRTLYDESVSDRVAGLRVRFMEALERIASYQILKQAVAAAGDDTSTSPLTAKSLRGQLRQASRGISHMVPTLATNEFIAATLADNLDLDFVAKMVVEFLREPNEP